MNPALPKKKMVSNKRKGGVKNKNNRKHFSLEAIRRLTLYLRNLRRIKKSGIGVISSDKITQFLNVAPAQFRKDLSYFGEFGKRGVGYEVDFLIRQIRKIVGAHLNWNIALVGLGRVGGALLGFEGFSKYNIKIAVVFDMDKKKIGRIKQGIKVESVANLEKIIREKRIKIAIIATPPEAAQTIANRLVETKIKGILNFAPVALKVPDSLFVSNVDMACELESLIFLVRQKRG